jgi:hypothetical protein
MKQLTREQMKTITGGLYGGDGGGEGSSCSTSGCSVYDSNTGNTYSGTCGTYILAAGRWGVASICECQTSLGPYDVQGGASHCVVS